MEPCGVKVLFIKTTQPAVKSGLTRPARASRVRVNGVLGGLWRLSLP
jgi:hypothetical protein